VNAIRAIIDISCKDLFCDADDRDAKLACREVVVKPVIYPLKLQLKRVEVGDLQQALSFLGLTIAGEEKKNQRFGATTRAAVRQFQVGHKLPETGEVDEATALAINEELADRGARHRTWIRQRSSGPESAYQLQTAALGYGDPAQSLSCVVDAAGRQRRLRLPDPRYADQGRDFDNLSKDNGASEVVMHVVQPLQRDF
jgi:hypothetical protein